VCRKPHCRACARAKPRRQRQVASVLGAAPQRMPGIEATEAAPDGQCARGHTAERARERSQGGSARWLVRRMQHRRRCQGSKPQGPQERGSVQNATLQSVRELEAMKVAPEGQYTGCSTTEMPKIEATEAAGEGQCAGGSTVNARELEASEAAPEGQHTGCSTTENAKDRSHGGSARGAVCRKPHAQHGERERSKPRRHCQAALNSAREATVRGSAAWGLRRGSEGPERDLGPGSRGRGKLRGPECTAGGHCCEASEWNESHKRIVAKPTSRGSRGKPCTRARVARRRALLRAELQAKGATAQRERSCEEGR